MRPVGSCSSMPSITGGLNFSSCGPVSRRVWRGWRSLPTPPIGSWESLVDVVAGSSPVGGTRSYCIPNRAGESQFPSVSPPEPTIGLSPRVRGNLDTAFSMGRDLGSIPACAGEPTHPSGLIDGNRSIPACAGEPVWASAPSARRMGLSPRVRGNLALIQGPDDRHGSIPACAGEPSCPARQYILSGVYPRVCGGTPKLRRLGHAVAGSIPACAGEPIPLGTV